MYARQQSQINARFLEPMHPTPHPKRHLDRFSRFSRLTIMAHRQTDRQTDHATPSVIIGRIYVVL